MEELEPCPFCGTQPVVDKFANGFYVMCAYKKCPMEECYTRTFAKKKTAIAAWNRRTK